MEYSKEILSNPPSSKKKELKTFISNNYPKIKNIKNIKLISHDNINSINYLICTKKQNYILRNYKNYFENEKIEKICQILNYCAKNETLVSKPIKNNKRKYVDSKKRYYLTYYYPGKNFQRTKKEFLKFAQALALLHKTLEKNKIKYNFRTYNSQYKILNIDEIKTIRKIIYSKKIKNESDRIFLKNFSLIIKALKHNTKFVQANTNSKIKKQLIHFDLHPGNIIFNKGVVSAIIDFNLMRSGLRIQDITFGAFRFAINMSKNPKYVSDLIIEFLIKYHQYNNLDTEEIIYCGEYLIQSILIRLSRILRMEYFIFDYSNYSFS